MQAPRPRAPTDAQLLEQAQALGVEFDESLPVSARWLEIAQAIAAHPVTILCGETGSGKTTQLPKIALALGRGANGRTIAHTQPRRLAATSVARRIAQELKSPLGEGPDARVGYRIRFQDRSRPGIPIRLMTDGILLAEAQSDPLLRRYDTIIVDEAHERSLNIDFLLGLLHGLIRRRPDLRLVITSATLDAQKFAEHFGQNGRPAPVLEVSGRMYPVEVRWRPPSSPDEDLIDRLVSAVEETLRERLPPGVPEDILCFLPGEREIRAATDALADLIQRRQRGPGGTGRGLEVLPLFGRLSQSDQEKIFRSGSGGPRRVVLSTNLAETSITVPGIGVVIDSGLARVKRYRIKGKVEQLQDEPISQAQANQRMGRAGRLGPGLCLRLYDEADFRGRPEHPDPEVLRSSLASVILQMKSLGLGDPSEFPFVDPPSKRAVADGIALLKELGALTAEGDLNPVGRQLAELPLDPRFGRMLIEARQRGCLREVVIIVSGLSTQDPRERPLDRQQAADAAHRRFADERSEFVSWVRLWDWVEEQVQSGQSRRQTDQALKAGFLSPLRVREWRDVHRQVWDWVLAQGWRENEKPADHQALHLSLLTGLLSNIGCRIDEAGKTPQQAKTGKAGPQAAPNPRNQLWQGAHEVKFSIWPGSALAKKAPRWLMAAEQVETSRLFARTLAAIEPEWLEQLAPHLIRVSYGEPRWEKKAGRAVGWARGVLYGLTVYAQRRVSWASLGPEQAAEARGLLIREGLVGGEIETRLPFLARNQRLVAEIERLEQKARRHDLLVDEGLIEAFYDQQLPQSVVDRDSLEAWVRSMQASNPDLLVLRKEDLMRHEAAGITSEQFPKQVDQSGVKLALDYRFRPGERDDGMLVRVPVAALGQVDAQSLDWMVPGMRKEKVMALLRSLPQRHRRHLLPLADYAEGFCGRWADRAGRLPLLKALAEDIAAEKGLSIGVEEFKRDGLPLHLSPVYMVLDEHGRQLALSRDLEQLRAQYAKESEAAFTPEVSDTVEKDWTFGDLSAAAEIKVGGQRIPAFRALEPFEDGVRLRLLERADKAQALHQQGLIVLIRLTLKEQLRALEKEISRDRVLALGWAALGMKDDPLRHLVARAIRRAYLTGDLPMSEEAYRTCLAEGRTRFMLTAQTQLRWLQSVVAEAQPLIRRIQDLRLPAQSADLKAQLERLLPKDFLDQLPDERARHLPRYLKAMAVRLDRIRLDPDRDHLRLLELQPLEAKFWKWAQSARGPWSDEMVEFRWQLEELRVQMFAQELRTPQPVSLKRLEKSWSMLAAQRSV